MNVYLHELKAYKKSTIIWSSTIVLLLILLLAMFPTFRDEIESVKNLFKGFPEPLLKSLGMQIENFGSILGFYSFVFMYIALCGSIQAMNLGLSILSKEISQKTADFILTKPIKRTQIITSKLLASLTSIIVTNILFIISAYIMISIVNKDEYSFNTFILISLSLFFIQIMLLSLGFIISVISKKIKSVISISLGVVFGFFFIGMFGSVIGDEAIRYLTPFKYFDMAYIIKNRAYEIKYIIFELVFIVAAILFSYIIYAKKDIHAV